MHLLKLLITLLIPLCSHGYGYGFPQINSSPLLYRTNTRFFTGSSTTSMRENESTRRKYHYHHNRRINLSSTSLASTSAPTSSTKSKSKSKSRASLKDHQRQDPRTIESELLRLSRQGKTTDALSLYQSLWDNDIKNNQNDDNNNNNNNTKDGDKKQKKKQYLGTLCKPSTRLMNHAITACAKCPKEPMVKKAFEIYEYALKGGDSGVRRLCPNVYTFGALMSVCARGGDVKRCIDLMEEMRRDYKIQPNAVIYSTLFSACERSNPPKPNLAIKLLQQAVNKNSNNNNKDDDENDNENIMMDGQMNIVGYNAALSACATGGEWKLALQLLDEMNELSEMKNGYDNTPSLLMTNNNDTPRKRILDLDTICPPPDEVTYGTVMAACEKAKKWDEVLKLAHVMEGQTNSNIQMDGMALTSALHACQQLGLGNDALRFLEKMKLLSSQGNNEKHNNNNNNNNNGQRLQKKRKPLRGPDGVAYRLAISACARASQWEEGIRLLREMPLVTGKSPDVIAYTAAISGCVPVGEYRQALDLLDEMQAVYKLKPNVVTYSTTIRACATACVNELAKRREETLEDDNWDLATEWGADWNLDEGNTYQYQPSSSMGDLEPLQAAMGLLSEMTTNNTIAKPNIVTYNAAILTCAEGMDVSRAFDLFHELQERKLAPTIVTYGSLMLACERVGSVQGASQVFRAMKAQDASGDKTSIKPNEIIYGAAISCCRKAKQPDRALNLLRKMIKEGLSPNIATFNTVLMAQAEGDMDEASSNVDKAVLVFNHIKSKNVTSSIKPSRQTYNILIRAMAMNGRPSDAEHFLNEMNNDGFVPDVDLYTMAVAAYERNREPLKALRLMESMRKDGYDFYELKVLDKAFKRAVRVANAVGRGLQSSSNSTMT